MAGDPRSLGPDFGRAHHRRVRFHDFRVAPSQGSHFFQNLTAFQIGYFTVNPDVGEGFIDWQWLTEQAAVEEHGCVRHLQFGSPIVVMMNGKLSRGMILKPETTGQQQS